MATRSTSRKARVDVNDVVGDVVPLVRAELDRQQVALTLDLAPGLPLALGDRVQLQQVLLNLIMNAVEAMAALADRPRQLHIRSARHDADHVAVAVRDTGPGIDPGTLDRLFTAFFTTKPGGMGMGLSISRSIIEAHGGRLVAADIVEGGASFQFTVPVVAAHADAVG